VPRKRPVSPPRSSASPDRAAFPVLWPGRRPRLPFRGLLRLYHVMARRFARPPDAAFVAGLRLGWFAIRAARQLPGQPTIARVGLTPTRCSRRSRRTKDTKLALWSGPCVTREAYRRMGLEISVS
jgi:hypothetical protein